MTMMVAGEQEYRAECAVWQNITDSISGETTVPMNCKKNIQCTGIDCSCEFSYNVSFTGGFVLWEHYFVVHVAFEG